MIWLIRSFLQILFPNEKVAAITPDVEITEREKLLDFAFAEGKENCETHIKSLEIIQARATTLTSFLIAALGVTGGYVIKLLGSKPASPSETISVDPAIVASVAWLCAYFFLLGVLTVWTCLKTKPVAPASNTPLNLFQPPSSLMEIKEEEIKNLDLCCMENQELAARNGKALNLMYFLTFGSPIVGFVAWLFERP